MRTEILMRQVHEPEGQVHWTSIKIEALVHYLIEVLKHIVNKTVINLIRT